MARPITHGGMKVRAAYNGAVIAESQNTVVTEGNHYFPPGDVNREYLQVSSQHTVCPWKGTASYYDVVVGDSRSAGAAWYYPETYEAADPLKGRIAFWRGVEVGPANEG